MPGPFPTKSAVLIPSDGTDGIVPQTEAMRVTVPQAASIANVWGTGPDGSHVQVPVAAVISADAVAATAPWTRVRSRVLAAALGDSLAAALHLDVAAGTFRNLNARHPLNWANGFSGGRLQYVNANRGNFGVSGERTDQIMARVPAVINSGAGLVWLIAGTNDIAQLYPTAATCAATAAANIATMIQQLNAAGIVVICEMVLGAANYSATQLGYMNELNQRLIEFVAKCPPGMVYLHDASRMEGLLDIITIEDVWTRHGSATFSLT